MIRQSAVFGIDANYRILTPLNVRDGSGLRLPVFDASVLTRFCFLFSEFCLLFSRRQNPVVSQRFRGVIFEASKTGSVKNRIPRA
jgi:hypothetical protein